MSWHALTFDGLADSEFAERLGDEPAPATPGSLVVGQVMSVVAPHIQNAVKTGINDAVARYRTQLIWTGVAAGAATAVALLFLRGMSSRLRECCPRRA